MSHPLFEPSPLITAHHNVVMAAGTDSVEAVDEPVTNGDVKSINIPAQSTHTSISHYLGLPYQDHNYGQPPPPTPPQSPPPTLSTVPVLPLSNLCDNANPSFTPPEDNADTAKDDGVTRCICNFDHDDGYMICCDKCLVWQHVECMGLDRNNIPDVYFCERCDPRPVDQERAVGLQTIKRKRILERLDSSDDETKRNHKKRRYSSISNTPTSLTLTTTKVKKKIKKKKKKKEKEKEKVKEKVKDGEKEQKPEKHHKKKKKKKFDLSLSSQRKHRKNRARTEPAIGNLLLHGEQILDSTDHFVEASENQYSPELNQFLAEQRQNALWTIPSLGCILDDLSPQKIKLGVAGRTARGLVATEELAPNQPIVEYRGMLMLKDQFVPANGSTKKPYLHVLMYTKFSNVELCVDARKYGNIARYVRKSCSPNAEVRHVAIDGLLRLYLFSLVEVRKGAEVTVAFDFSYKDCSHPVKCGCCKKNCPVKRYWRKRRALEARNQKKPNTDRRPVFPSKRTVSPLRVSLTAANNAEKHVEQVIGRNDPPEVIQVEVPPATSSPTQLASKREEPHHIETIAEVGEASDTEHKDKVDVVAVDVTPQTDQDVTKEKESADAPASSASKEEGPSRRKMTREERKMEAIMKAFEKLEKAQVRRQQALERLAHSKPQDGEQEDKEQESKPQQLQEKQQQQQGEQPQESLTTTTSEGGHIGHSDSGKDEQAMTSEPTPKDESSSNMAALTVTPTTTRKPARRRRRSAMSIRRRHRSSTHASAASASTSVEVSSADDDSNQAPLPGTSGLEKFSLLSTPLSVSTGLLPTQDKPEAPLASPGSSSSKRFRFPKTKKFFMNEWLNEKAFESLAGKPLTIKTEQLESSFSSNLPSPNTPVLQRSGSLSALVRDSRTSSLESSGGLGSAKKRWLRQAMSEGNNSQDLSTCNGTVSPIASPALSPNTSLSSDLMTPLKKRMLRHSLAEEASPGGSSPKHEAKGNSSSSSSEAPLAAATTTTTMQPSLPDAPPSDDPPILIQAKTDLPPVQEEGSLFVTSPEAMKSRFTLTFSLPARKETRKNSSIDSGLSVTTPAELEKSPINIKAGLEERLQEFSGEPMGQETKQEKSTDEKDKLDVNSNSEDKTSGDTLLGGVNNNLIKEDSSREKEKEEETSKGDGTNEKESKGKDESDGTVTSDVDGRTKSPVTDNTSELSKSGESAVHVKSVSQETPADVSKAEEMQVPSERSKVEIHVNKSEDSRSQSLTNVSKGDPLNSLYVSSLRTRHVSGPGAMQGYGNESGPLTLNTSSSDDCSVSSSNVHTPFSPKKRLLRQNTDPSEQREGGPSMASSWPQQTFASPQRYVRPKEESQGVAPQTDGNPPPPPPSVQLQGASPNPVLAHHSPERLSASWGPGGRLGPMPGPMGPSTATLKPPEPPGSTPSPSPSPGPPPMSASPPAVLKAGASPLSAVRNLGSSLTAASGGPQDAGDAVVSQPQPADSASSSIPSSGESSAANSAQSTPVKKKVSLLEYRKRRGSSVKPTSSSASSSSSSSSTTTSLTSTSITASLVGTTATGSTKLPLITLPNIPLPDIPPTDPLKDEPGKKQLAKTPVKPASSSPSPAANSSLKPQGGKLTGSPPKKGESAVSSGKPGPPTSKPPSSNQAQSGFAIFSTKTKDGQTPTLTLTSEAQQVINSITSLLMEESHVHNGDIKERSIRRSDSVPADSRYSRRNYQDKPWEKDGRGDAAGSLKRPLSPEPPPPPPGKKLCTVGPVPPPPPPKGTVPRDARPGENSPAVPLRQNSAPGVAVNATNSPLKNVSGNTMVPAQYGIAHRAQNPQFPLQYPQQPQQFATNAFHPQRPTQQPPQAPQQQLPQQQQQQQQQGAIGQQPPRPIPPPQKHVGNFSYPYGTQPTEKASAQGFSQQHSTTGYPPMPYRQNQNQHGNHFGIQNKFSSSNGRKSPYGSQDSSRPHTYFNRSNSNSFAAARKNFHSQ